MAIYTTHTIRQPLVVSSGWTTTLFSATTISAGTFYGGSLSASFVGNKNVNDQEFKYVSGLTSNAQNQFNGLVDKNEPLITYQTDNFLTNEKSLSAGTNMSSTITSTHFGLSASFPSLEVSAITISITQTAITDFNPTNWQVSDNIRSTHIIVTGSGCTIVSGLVGGTNGRIVVITNNSLGLIILENLSSKCQIGNRFKFNIGGAYFLPQKRSVTLIYNISDQIWEEMYPSSNETIFTLFSDYLTTMPYPIPFGTSVPLATFASNGLSYLNNEFNTLGVITFSSGTPTEGTSAWSNSCLGRAFTQTGNTFYPSLTISKIRINDVYGYTGFTDKNTSLFICDNSLNNGSATALNARTSCAYWRTPVTSITYTDTTVWYYGSNTIGYQPSSVKLSATTNDWIYFGIYDGGLLTTPTAFFHSYNGNEYEWDFIGFVNIAANTGGGGFYGVGSYTNKILVSPKISVDWYGVITPGIK
jgi:hypothetical protein